MELPRFVEFRDLGGDYVLARPLDEVRCRVLASNTLPRGELLYKPASLPWDEAGLDLGGYTRLTPEDLRTGGGEVPREEGLSQSLGEDLLRELQTDEDVQEDAHREVDRRAGSRPRVREAFPAPPDWADLVPEPEGMVLRLAVHYRLRHERGRGKDVEFEVCRCSKYAPREDLALAWFHELTYRGLRERRVPSLARMLRAIAKASFRVLRREEEDRAAA